MAYSARATLPAPARPTGLQRAGTALRRAWRDYWYRRAQRATVALLQSLDAQSLRDIGINRSEIESVVYGPPVDRRHRYEGGCW